MALFRRFAVLPRFRLVAVSVFGGRRRFLARPGRRRSLPTGSDRWLPSRCRIVLGPRTLSATNELWLCSPGRASRRARTRALPSRAALFTLIQLMDPVNQIVIAGCTSHDRVQLVEPFVFRSVIKRHPRLSRVVPKYNFIPMDRLDL
jgi:hypothetical protein